MPLETLASAAAPLRSLFTPLHSLGNGAASSTIISLALLAGGLEAQGAPASTPLTAQVSSGEWVGAELPLQFQLNRAPNATERVLVTAGTRDLSPQLERDGLTLRFSNRGVPLAPGRHELTVILLRDDTLATELLRQVDHRGLSGRAIVCTPQGAGGGGRRLARRE